MIKEKIGMISLIAAISENNVIGKDNSIPWHIPQDFKLFKNFTKDNVVIMGRNTWDSLPKKPLPNRINVVVSSKMKSNEVIVCNSIEEAIDEAEKFQKDIYIIGGSRLYAEGLKYCDNLHISHIKGKYEGDTFFPNINFNDWKIEEEQIYDKFIFRKYSKK